MKFKSPMLVVRNMELTKTFYQEVLGLRITMDLGANVTMTGGLAFQTQESWESFIHASSQDIQYHGNDMEIYFEENDIDAFITKLDTMPNIQYVHEIKEHDWGQRVVRFYDPDFHIIEVGESMDVVCRRYYSQGMSYGEIAKKTLFPISMVQRMIKK